MKTILAATIAALSLTTPSFAFVDASGLGIELSSRYQTTPLQGYELAPDAVGFAISSRDPALAINMGGELCRVAFLARVERSPLSQQELNRVNGMDYMVEAWRTNVIPGAKILDVLTFEQDGIFGLDRILRSKDSAGYLTVWTTFQTPAGQTDISCTATESEFETLRPIFEEIRRGVTPPA